MLAHGHPGRLAGALLALSEVWAVGASTVAIRGCASSEEQMRSCKAMLDIPVQRGPYGGPKALGKEQCIPAKEGDMCYRHDCVLYEDCYKAVMDRDADWAVADPMMMWWLSTNAFGAQQVAPAAKEVRGNVHDRARGTGGGEGADYYSVALVRTADCNPNGETSMKDFEGKRSCHNRYGDLAGWAFPVSFLETQRLATGDSDVGLVQSFFDASCAPGNGEDKICSACKVTDGCNNSDKYAGDDGAIQGLRDGACDIAFVDHWAAFRLLAQPSEKERFSLLCNSRCRPILENVRRPGCYLGEAPPDAVIVNEDNDLAGLLQRDLVRAGDTARFKQLFNRDNGGSAMFSSFTVRLQEVKGTLGNYLGSFKRVMDEFVRDSAATQQAATALTPAAGGGGGGVPKWGVALLVIASLAGGLAAGAFAMKAFQRRRRERDTYKGSMDYVMQAGGGMPDGGDLDGDGHTSSFSLQFPEANLPEMPPPPPRPSRIG